MVPCGSQSTTQMSLFSCLFHHGHEDTLDQSAWWQMPFSAEPAYQPPSSLAYSVCYLFLKPWYLLL